jgi:hypothetical protein
MAACPYCGQMVAVETDCTLSVDEGIRRAGECCDCTEALIQRHIRDVVANVRSLCAGGEEAPNGFRRAVSPEVVELLEEAAAQMVRGRIAKVTLIVGSGDEITLKDSAKGIRVRRSRRQRLEL